MRKLEEVQRDYSQLCLEHGNLSFKKSIIVKEMEEKGRQVEEIHKRQSDITQELFKLSDEAQKIEQENPAQEPITIKE